jgi:hypothetical protein
MTTIVFRGLPDPVVVVDGRTAIAAAIDVSAPDD